MTDVGDGVDLTYNTTPGATVTAVVTGPDDNPSSSPVTESPTGSGAFPFTFVVTAAGPWHVVFSASGTVTAVDDYWVTANAIPSKPPLATVDDVVDMFRPLSTAEAALATSLIRRASAMLRAPVPTIDARLAAGTLDPVLVSTAIAQMVLRVMKNLSALVQQTVGPFSVTYNKDAAAGYLSVTQGDLALVVDTTIEQPRPASTIRVGSWRPHDPFEHRRRHVPR